MSAKPIDAYSAFLERSSGAFKMRTPGSCRFSPYYKAQWYDAKTMAWRDIAKRFTTTDEARKCFDKKRKWRLMEISMNGRIVL